MALAGAALTFSMPADEEKPDKPETPADKIAGRWRITLEGLPDKHADILASFAVNGEILEGSFSVDRNTVPISAGRIAGDRLDVRFHHAGGEEIRMKGRVGPRGLEGTWETRDLRGKWSARRLSP